MTVKQKAEDLVNEFAKIQQQIEWTDDKQLMELCGERNEALGEQGEYYWHELAKQSALIAVDQILLQMGTGSETHFWMKVKQVIKKL